MRLAHPTRMTALTAPAHPAHPARQDVALIGLVGLAHGISHFSQLLLPPLFPWLKDAFGVSFTELGLLMTIFFVVSCVVQAASGFVVDRFGPRPVLFGGLALLGLAAFGYAASPSYGVLALCTVVAGVGNGVFHPVDFTLLNRKVHASRLGHAFSAHGITGSLGWALAPVLMVPLAMAYSWRVALASAGALAFVGLAVLWLNREQLALDMAVPKRADLGVGAGATATATTTSAGAEGSFDFLTIPAVWMCFGFFFFFAASLSGVQTFAPAAAQMLHGVPVGITAMKKKKPKHIHTAGIFRKSKLPSAPAPALVAVAVAVAPLLYGALMDHHRPALVWIAIAAVQALLIVNAFNVRKVRRTRLVAA